MKQKVVLDTDIGSDIDDAVCLAYLLANPQCDLLGITTVTGEPVKRARMASVLCEVAGRKIPIYPGTEQPLLNTLKQRKAQQAKAAGNWKHQKRFPKSQAIEFLRETIHANPGEVTLLAIGPMTNIGLLFATDPEIAGLLKQLVLMCGVFTPQYGPLEWNAIGDPHATAIVYNHHPAVHRSIGLDVTRQVVMDADTVRERFAAPLLKPVLEFADVWFQNVDRITFHDPLAAATIFDDSICTFTRGTVDVELASPRLQGYTAFAFNDDGPHEVALEVDSDRFFSHFFGVF